MLAAWARAVQVVSVAAAPRVELAVARSVGPVPAQGPPVPVPVPALHSSAWMI